MEERKDENLDTPVDEFESNEARRQRLLGIENDSKIHDQGLEITKGNFFKNLWYKRKWTVLIAENGKISVKISKSGKDYAALRSIALLK